MLYVSIAHAAHAAVPVAYVPAGQVVAAYSQLEAPSILYVSVAHAAHAAVPVAYVPAGQVAVQELPFANVFSGH